MPPVKAVNYGLKSLPYIGPNLLDSIPFHMKKIDSVNEFKHIIKNVETWFVLVQTL